MSSPRPNTVVAILALTTFAGGIIAWRQHAELAELRAAAPAENDAALRQQLAAAQARIRELEDRLAARFGGGAEPTGNDGAPAARVADDNTGRGFGPRGGRGGPEMRAMFDSPLAQRVMQQQQKLALDSRYAPLFKALNLPPDKLDKFKSLLLDKQTAVQDVMAAAFDQGIDPRANGGEVRKMIASAQAEIDTNLKALLGDDAFAQYDQFQRTQPQRNVVNQLQQSLSYTAAPLSTAQADQLVAILTANTAARPTGDGGGPGMFADGGGRGGFGRGGPMDGGNGGGATITTEAVSAAQQILSAPQLTALQQLQQTQQEQQQLSQQLRANRGDAPPPRGG